MAMCTVELIINEKENKNMKHEELLKEIDEMIKKNYRLIIMSAPDKKSQDHLRNMNNLLGKIKTVLRDTANEYERGAEDAWDLARRVACLSHECNNAFTSNDLCTIFNTINYPDTFRSYTGTGALERYKAYEKEKEEAAKLKPGDVVTYYCGRQETAILLYENDCIYYVLKSAGDCPQNLSKSDFVLRKTGKHINLEDLFENIQEG